MSLFRKDNECDVCGAKLDPEDVPVHLCKICQAIQPEKQLFLLQSGEGGEDDFGEEGFVVEVFDEIHGLGAVVGKFFGHVIFGGFGNDFDKQTVVVNTAK